MSNIRSSTVAFLGRADATSIVGYLTDDVVLAEQGRQAMLWLLEHRPAMADEVLCHLYGVTCYCVGDSCFKDQAPAEDHQKWFVSTLASSSLAAENLPLADSEAQARRIAVTHLGFQDVFLSKEDVLTA